MSEEPIAELVRYAESLVDDVGPDSDTRICPCGEPFIKFVCESSGKGVDSLVAMMEAFKGWIRGVAGGKGYGCFTIPEGSKPIDVDERMRTILYWRQKPYFVEWDDAGGKGIALKARLYVQGRI